MEPRLGDVPPVIEPPLEIPPQLAEDFARVARLAEAAEDKLSDYESSISPDRLMMLRDTGFMPLFMHLASLYTKAQSIAEANPTEANQRLVTRIKQSIDTRVKDMATRSQEEDPSIWRSNLKAVVSELSGTAAAEAPVIAPEPTKEEVPVIAEAPATPEVAPVETPIAPIEQTPEPEDPAVEWTEQLDAALKSLEPLPELAETPPVAMDRPEEENWAKVEVSNETRERMGQAVAAATQAQKLLASYNRLLQEPNPDQDELNSIWDALGTQIARVRDIVATTLSAKEIPTERINDYLKWLYSEADHILVQNGVVGNLESKLNNIAQATNYVSAALIPGGVDASGRKVIVAEPILPGMADAEEGFATIPGQGTALTVPEQPQSQEQMPSEFTVTTEQGEMLTELFTELNDLKRMYETFVEAEATVRAKYGNVFPKEQQDNIAALYSMLRDKAAKVKSLFNSLVDSLVATRNQQLDAAILPAELLVVEIDRDGMRSSRPESIGEYGDKLNRAIEIYRSVMANKINVIDSAPTDQPNVPTVTGVEFEPAGDIDTPEDHGFTPEQLAHLRALNQAVGERDQDLTRRNLERGTKALKMINGAIDRYKKLPKVAKWGITAAFIGGGVTVSMLGGAPFGAALAAVLTQKAFNIVAGTAVGFTASKIIEKSIDMGMEAASKKWKPWFDKYPEATKFIRELRGVVGTAGGMAAGIWAAGLAPSGEDIVQFTSKVGDTVPNIPGFGLDEAARAVTDSLRDQFDGPAGTGDSATAETTKVDPASPVEKPGADAAATTTEAAGAAKAVDAPADAAAAPAEKTPSEAVKADADTKAADAKTTTTAPTQDPVAAAAEKAAAAVVKAADAASVEVPASAIAPETVESGDTVWAMIREDMETRPELKDAFNALTPEEQNVAIDRIENRLQALSAQDIQDLGIKSGDLDAIQVGEVIDLEKAIDASDLKDAVEGKAVEMPTAAPTETPQTTTTETAPVEKPAAAAPVTVEPPVVKPTPPTAAVPPTEAAPAPAVETAAAAAPTPPETTPNPEGLGWTNVQTQGVMTSLVNHFIEQPKSGFLSGLFGASADDAAAVSWLYGEAGEPTGINGSTVANIMSNKPEGPYTPQAVTSVVGFLEKITAGTGIDLNSTNWQNATVEEVTQAALSKGMELKTPWFTEFLNSTDARGVRTLLGG